MLTQFRNLYHGFEKRGQAITRVTSTRLELDNIYREAKGMLHMTLCNGSSYDFTHIWEPAVLLGTATDYRTRYDLGRVHVYVNLQGHALKGKGAHSDVIRMEYGWRVQIASRVEG